MHKCVKALNVEKGQWVRVKLPKSRFGKGELRSSFPQLVEEVNDNGSAIRLKNGQWWNTGRVVKVKPPCVDPLGTRNAHKSTSDQRHDDNESNHPKSTRRLPVRYSDYAM